MLSGDWVAVAVEEAENGGDLNDDGCANGSVIYLHNFSTGETKNTGLSGIPGRSRAVSGDSFTYKRRESRCGLYLNGDGDTNDFVVYVHNFSTGETVNLGPGDGMSHLAPNWVLFQASEAMAGEDLNGDGDRADDVIHLYNTATGDTVNLQLAVRLFRHGILQEKLQVSGTWFSFRVIESAQGEDLNGDGIASGSVSHLVNLSQLSRFSRGDANADGARNVTDAVFLLNYLFGGGTVPPCLKSADTNDSGSIDLSDAVFLLNFLFKGGTPPPAPFDERGWDPTPDHLSCEMFPSR